MTHIHVSIPANFNMLKSIMKFSKVDDQNQVPFGILWKGFFSSFNSSHD